MTYVAAANGALWQNSLTCGACFRITGTGRGLGANPIAGTYIGIVTDSCPGCKSKLTIILWCVLGSAKIMINLTLFIPGWGGGCVFHLQASKLLRTRNETSDHFETW